MEEEHQQADVPPWERIGSVRRDCEPHRGLLIQFVGTLGLLCGFLTMFLVFPGVFAIPLWIVTRTMSQGDLAKMETGLMDPSAIERVEDAWESATIGVIITVVCWGFYVPLYFITRWIFLRL